MKQSNFAERLRFYRQKMGLSVKEVSEELAKKDGYVSIKTVYSWENGTSQPSADTLMRLCELYRIGDVLETFGYQNRSNDRITMDSLSYEEKNLIYAYRNFPEYKAAIRKLYDL